VRAANAAVGQPWLAEHKSAFVRAGAAYVLAATGSDPDATRLVMLLDDRSSQVRVQVARHLIALDRARFELHLKSLLNDPSPQVRQEVERLLRPIQNP
jgi:HEAT repeat protein